MTVAGVLCTLVAGVLIAAAVAEAATAQSAKKAKQVRVELGVTTQTQAELLERGRLAVRLRSIPKGGKKGIGERRASAGARKGKPGRGKTTVKLRAKQGQAKGLVEPKTVKLPRSAKKAKRLRLTQRGREVLGACGEQRVAVKGRYNRKGRGGKGRGKRRKATARAKRTLVADQSRCPSGGPIHVDVENPDRCDPIDPARCLLPFPNDYYTVRDQGSATGRRVDLKTASMPANASGTHIDAAPYNASDGFSPGQPIVLKVPGLDNPAALAQTDAVPINDLGRYTEPDAPVVVIDAETGERWPIWVEIDSHASGPEGTALLIHAATNLASGHRYIVALRDLRTAAAETIQPNEVFRAYRDGVETDNAAVEARRPHMEQLFGTLADAGIARDDLYLAWDFTVASDMSIAERMLHIRDDAFAELGDTNLADLDIEGEEPQFEVDTVEEFSEAEDPQVAREVRGTVTVPCYLEPDCAPGGRFELGGDGLPSRNGDWTANFECIVPRAALDGTPAQPSLYGHGLLGDAGEVRTGKLRQLGNDHDLLFCATDWIGMSESDVPNVAGILRDLSRFPTLADRVQQGMLDFLYLGRAMVHPDGFSSDPAFHVDGTADTPSVIDTSRLHYDGGSQGGIIGGALTAVAPDFTRAALGVPGMNYAVLIPRSVDFDPFDALFRATYPDDLSRALNLSLIQMLWDRGEANGYAHRMTDRPLPGTPPHQVLLHEAFGDHQVANIATETEARTLGAEVRAPILDPGRSRDAVPLWGVPRIESFPFGGSAAIVVWDVGPLRVENGEVKGTPPPPLENLPNRDGVDPHGPDGSETIEGQAQIAHFLRNGQVIDTCGAHPCYLDGYTGPGG